MNNDYFNIETGELICRSYTSMQSDDHLFLDNQFDDDKTKRGVWKINKLDATVEIFKIIK